MGTDAQSDLHTSAVRYEPGSCGVIFVSETPHGGWL